MEVVKGRCAFLDVHRDTVTACARTPDPSGGCREEVAEFGTTTSQLLKLAEWLVERDVALVGMEATGIFWKPVHWILEDEIARVWVINARHMRNVPGRKTDVNDAIWGPSLLEHGLVRPSFLSPVNRIAGMAPTGRLDRRRIIVDQFERHRDGPVEVVEQPPANRAPLHAFIQARTGRAIGRQQP